MDDPKNMQSDKPPEVHAVITFLKKEWRVIETWSFWIALGLAAVGMYFIFQFRYAAVIDAKNATIETLQQKNQSKQADISPPYVQPLSNEQQAGNADNSVAVGPGAKAYGDSVAIGHNATAGAPSTTLVQSVAWVPSANNLKSIDYQTEWLSLFENFTEPYSGISTHISGVATNESQALFSISPPNQSSISVGEVFPPNAFFTNETNGRKVIFSLSELSTAQRRVKLRIQVIGK